MRSRQLRTALLVLSIVLAGCGKGENPVSAAEEFDNANLFPFAIGRHFVYSAHALDTAKSQKIPSTVHRRASYIGGTEIIGGRSAFRLVDTVYTPSGSIAAIDTAYYTHDGKDLLLWSGTWLTIVKRTAGLNSEYVAGEIVQSVFGFPFVITVKGTIFPKERIGLPLGSLDAYRVELTSSATVGTFTAESILHLYFADGHGLVRQVTPVQRDPEGGAREEGAEMVLVSKNF